MSKVAYVSGATGYIAQHIVKQLLAQGYTVIGSVRSKSKGDDLKSSFSSDGFKYEIVQDISAPHAFDQSLKSNPDISIFLHTASPVIFTSTEYKRDLLDPAIEGTKNALSAIKTHGKNISKVIVTSSFSSVGSFGKHADPSLTFTEKSFNPITYEESLTDPGSAYNGSKTLAEKEVWNFVKSESPSFKVTTIHPVYVFGPQANTVKDKSQLNFSAEIVNKVLKLNSNDEIPQESGYFIDVRDVAKAHISSITNEQTDGKRLVLSDGQWTNDLIAHIINKHFPSVDIPKGDLKRSERLIENGGFKTDFSQTESILGFKYIDLEKSVVDTVQQILDAK